MDFQERLADYIDLLNIDIPLYNDINDADMSISLYSLPGSAVKTRYFDGTVDKKLNYELLIKAPTEKRNEAVQALELITTSISSIIGLPSYDNSYDFQEITVSSETHFDDTTTDGFVYFRSTFEALLTIYN